MDLPTELPPRTDTEWPARPQPPRRPGILSGIGMVVLYFVMQLAVGFVVAIVLAIGYAIYLGTQGRMLAAGAITAELRSPNGRVVLTVVSLMVVAALMLWIIRRRWPAQWSVAMPPGFGFVAPENRWFFLWAILVAVAGALGGAFLTQALAHGHAIHQDVTVLGREAPLALHVALSIVVVCVAPVVEEALFRGVLLSGLLRHMSAAWAVLVSAIIFGGVHYPDFAFVWYPLPALVLLGVLLAWIRLHSRSLWPAITLHATNNLIAVIITWTAIGHTHG